MWRGLDNPSDRTEPLSHGIGIAQRISIGSDPHLLEERGLAVRISHKQTVRLVLFSLLFLIGCSASNHPMTQMVRMQQDMMQELADVLHGVDDMTDLEAAIRQIENLTEQMQRRMVQVTKSMGEDGIPTSESEAKRLQAAMQRELKKLQPIMKQIQEEMDRLAEQDWSAPLLEATKKYKFESNVKLS